MFITASVYLLCRYDAGDDNITKGIGPQGDLFVLNYLFYSYTRF